MAARELEATGNAVLRYRYLCKQFPSLNLRVLKESAAAELKISVATLNRALKRRIKE